MPLYACLRKKEDTTFIWTATDQSNLEDLKSSIREVVRLQPRDPTARLIAEVNIDENEGKEKQLITEYGVMC